MRASHIRKMSGTFGSQSFGSWNKWKTVKTHIEGPVRVDTRQLDEAYDFLQQHAATENQVLDIAYVRRKIDRHIPVCLYFVYAIQSLDKFLFNYAVVMGMPEDLNLQGEQLNHASAALWETYLGTTIIIGFVLNRVPIGKWLGGVLTIWGILVTCTAAVQSYHGLVALRVLMGICDATIPPACMIISSQYYRKDEQVIRYAGWYTSVGSAMILGGLISYGFQHLTTTAIEGWRVMYIVLGGISIIIGIITFILLPDSPMQAWFLSDAEKSAVLKHVAINGTGVSNRSFSSHHIISVLRDPQLYFLTAGVIAVGISAGIVTLYSTTLVRGFGYTPKEAALLNMPSGLVGATAVLIAGLCIRKLWIPRWAIFAACNCCSIIGSAIMSFMPHSNRAAMLAGIYIAFAGMPTIMISFQWTAANVAGHTKRSIAVSLMSAGLAIGNIIGPYAVRQQDAPDFMPARITLVGTEAGAAVIVCCLALYYMSINNWRDKKWGREVSVGALHKDCWDNLTDGERRGFRYVY
ncbi:hypothetical protein CLAFUW4_13672 [Fulvia fulva]|uniref:Major facilitator superfamily (MFS) profile domain-containing protein n=1 Tax=Passalora fulva TaxID=5499 RepID=A0A9Q8PKQ3_PASFU|nr:uncharacterized protein CLAFUR5_13521 [Fulvia fulva]KAK4610217.1 hypothetical protein CLAFUR4_13675 [Fulvia fulva]KAK4610991.1 hypothetical protein CLAFUR0_13679 [Fulvia fulva]UJO24258.1 hypothetical protein CLAFUR5_13521 [Fulvia fulva]WPV21988.1 hypothetical protein CLAFUW4_13672 [Fulvia fulva]WPV37171.1 hypothetical protein CLAFUW7_13680 [Fulvia fulva]